MASSKNLALSKSNPQNPTSPVSLDPHPPTSDKPPLNEPPKSPEPTSPPSEKPKQHLAVNSNQISQTPPLRLPDTCPLLFITLTFNPTDQDYYA